MSDKAPATTEDFESYLRDFLDPEYRERVGPLGMLRLLRVTPVALRHYERQAVLAARHSGGDVAADR